MAPPRTSPCAAAESRRRRADAPPRGPLRVPIFVEGEAQRGWAPCVAPAVADAVAAGGAAVEGRFCALVGVAGGV